MITTDYFQQMMESPLAILDNTYDLAFKLTTEQVNAFQSHWVKKRFDDLRPGIAMLDKLAKEQCIDKVESLDDIAPLLFAHSVYKSYPLSYLERGRFDKLTKWLDGLTTTDLSQIDASAVKTIDGWIDLLDEQTPLRIIHTSGTTGKLSFIPRTGEQSRTMGRLKANNLRDWEGANSKPDMLKQHRPVINPGYRYGAGTAQRMARVHVELIAGSKDNSLFLYDDQRLSADMLSLAGRLRVAEARGEQGQLDISTALLQRREEYLELEKQKPQAMERFFSAAIERFGGQDIFISTIYGLVYDWAVEGMKRGHKGIFGPNSFLSCGGGLKGRVLPENWLDTIQEFLGFSTFSETYAMSECIGATTLCEHGKYHIPPWIVPFLLDPKTGKQLPRKDGTTGRFAFMDLLADNYWGGFVTGDAVTMSGWQQTCQCGRTGLHVERNIRRYSELEGGDDKVLCSGAPEAHDKALAFLTENSF